MKIFTFVLVSVLCMISCKSTLQNSNLDLPSLTDPIGFQKVFKETPTNQKILIDVRTPEEYQAGHLEEAINIDYYGDDFESKIKALDTTKAMFIYCKRGGRSASAHKVMYKAGIPQICELKGGFNAWKEQNLPVYQPTE